MSKASTAVSETEFIQRVDQQLQNILRRIQAADDLPEIQVACRKLLKSVAAPPLDPPNRINNTVPKVLAPHLWEQKWKCDHKFSSYHIEWGERDLLNGTGRYTFDRIGRGTLDIESTCVSVLGGIQPGPLSAYIRECVRGGRGDDGLLHRFQLLVWPDSPTEWANVDRWPDRDAKAVAYAMYQRLEKLDPFTIGAVPVENGLPFVRFVSDAQDEFNEWRTALEYRIRQDGDHDAIIAHLSKYRSLVPSLALLFHLADNGRDEAGIESIRRAIAWARYLETHARRLYGATVDFGRVSSQSLAKKILAGEAVDGFALRDIYNQGWANLGDRDEVAEAVKTLMELDWLVEKRETTPGRPATRYTINPKCLQSTKRSSE